MARKPTKPAKKTVSAKAKAKTSPSAKQPGPMERKLSPTLRAQLERIHALGVLEKKPTPKAKPAAKGVNISGETAGRPAAKDF